MGSGTEVEELPAVSLWAGQVGPLRTATPVGHPPSRRLVGRYGLARGHRLRPVGRAWCSPTRSPFRPPICAPWSPAGIPDLPVVGGYASGASGPGGTRLAVGDRVVAEGAVAVLLGPATEVVPVLSQGCRPFGRMLTVTRVERNLVLEIAGRPAMECMVDEIAEHLGREDIAGLEGNGLLLGRCVDATVLEPGPRDLLYRPLLGVERSSGALSVEDRVPLGDTVRFAVRDAATAAADLATTLAGRRADAALLFPCNGRGTRLFDDAHHDAGAAGRRPRSRPRRRTVRLR